MLRRITSSLSIAESANVKRWISGTTSLGSIQAHKKTLPEVKSKSSVREKLLVNTTSSTPNERRLCRFFEEQFQADSQILCNYLQACLFSGLFTHALNILEMRMRSMDGNLCGPSGMQVSPSKLARETQVYDIVLGRLSSISPKSEINCSFMENTKTANPLDIILKIFSEMRRIGTKPSPSSYAYVLEAMSKCSEQKLRIELCLQQAIKDGYTMADILGTCIPGSKSAKNVRYALTQVSSYDEYNAPIPINTNIDGEKTGLPALVSGIYKSRTYKPGALHLSSVQSFDKSFADQVETEKMRVIRVDNILYPRDDNSPEIRQSKIYLSRLLKEWREYLLKLFQDLKKREKTRHNENAVDWEGQFSPGAGNKIYPFLCLLPEQEYVDIMLDQLCSTTTGGEFTSFMSFKIGEEVYSRFHVRRLRDTGILSRVEKVYMDYTNLFISNELQSKLSPREFWVQLEDIHGLTNLEEKILPWNRYWSLMVGIRLVEILSTVSFSPNDKKCHRTDMLKKVPAVYNSYVLHDKKQFGMTVPHPQFRILLKNALDKLLFESEVVPMVVPPRPWCGVNRGGLLVNQVEFMRSNKVDETSEVDNLEENNLIPIFDSLNILGSVAWVINKPILDLQIKYFRDKGSKELSIPQPASVSETMPDLSVFSNKDSDAYKAARRKAIEIQKERKEMHALFMEGLYKLSIANAYRDKVIWFAHNIDFRGRFYPVSRHLNYMGADPYRSLFLFASGRPLGEKGLDWLKLHCINLTDFKKHNSIQERLDYADEVMDDILSSANDPEADGAWWRRSDKPWQTLAVCMEIDKALKSPDPTKFVSRLPIHQDGSCNGLQHYAALGRDVVGAQQVNLSPSVTPQDVYVGVANKTEEGRKKDAERGSEIAKILEGFVRRKVVKQTVMTTVYGVTRYGAVEQIKRQLGYLENEFPKMECARGASYLADKVFSSITEMFSGARNIQHWLIQIADTICKMGYVVDWKTPLNLLVTQPYYKNNTKYISSCVQRVPVLEPLPSLPNGRKQVNGFPPNFIHSLDSTHMMLTALHCHNQGVTFASVHDCFWTHACKVDEMGRICRKQFVALHSQPILHQLAQHLRKHLPPNSENLSPQQLKLKALLDNVPEQGKFDLNEVLSSTFFFS